MTPTLMPGKLERRCFPCHASSLLRPAPGPIAPRRRRMVRATSSLRLWLLRLAVAATAAALSVGAPIAWADSHYPTRPVRVIIPFPPAGAVDVVGRPLAERLSERLGQQFYIENIG